MSPAELYDDIDTPPVEAWHVSIMGFRQSVLHLSGVERVWRAVRHTGGGVNCVLTPREWDDDFEALAALIDRNSALDSEGNVSAKIVVSAYSWGGGNGFIQLAHALGSRGIRITHAVLCDAVYKSPLVSFGWRSLFNSIPGVTPKIVVPPNVDRVTWFYQRIDKPAGHSVVAEDPRLTTVDPGVHLGYGHTEIDESDDFRDAVVSALADAFISPGDSDHDA